MVPDVVSMGALADMHMGAGVVWPAFVSFPQAPPTYTNAVAASVTMKLPATNLLFASLVYSVEVTVGGSTDVVVEATTVAVSAGDAGSQVALDLDLSAYSATSGALVEVRGTSSRLRTAMACHGHRRVPDSPTRARPLPCRCTPTW